MMNDKIRLAADVLAALGGGVNEKTYDAALAHPQREEYLRAAFLANVKLEGLQDAMKRLLHATRMAFDKVDGRLAAEPQAMLQLLEDEDVITPADRAAAMPWMTNGEASNAMSYPYLLACIERVWQPTYDRKDGLFHWMRALADDSTAEAAKRLIARTDANSVAVAELAEMAQSLPALDVLASHMSREALVRECDKIFEKLETTKRGSGAVESTLLVLLSRLAQWRDEVDLTKGLRFVDTVMQRGGISHRLEAAVPYLARFAQLAGHIADPKFFALMASEGLRYIGNDQLSELLSSGMPASRQMPASRNHEAGLVHLLDGARLSQIPVLVPYMNEEAKDHFVRNRLVHKITKTSWTGEVQSCMDENWLTVLHRQGFDLGVILPGEKQDEEVRLHNAPRVFYAGMSSDFIFTTLHALGVYPKDLQSRGIGPLVFAAHHDDEPAIRALAALGYDLDDPQSRERPIAVAVKQKSLGALRALIELGADVGVKASSGASLLQLAKDDELKRMLRAARTGASVERAMAGSQESKQKMEPRREPGIL